MEAVNWEEVLEKNPRVDANQLKTIRRRLEEATAAGYGGQRGFRITRKGRAVVDEETLLKSKSIPLSSHK